MTRHLLSDGQTFLAGLVLLVLAFIGCDNAGGGGQVAQGTGTPGQGTATQSGTGGNSPSAESRPAIKTTRLSSGGPNRQTNRDAQSLTEEAAVASITSVLADYAQAEPTLVVWLFDSASQADPLVGPIAGELRAWYDDAQQVPGQLETAVATYHEEVEFLVEAPSAKPAEVSAALGKVRSSGEGPSATMQSVEQVLERFRGARENEGKVVIVALVTMGTGADWEKAGEVASLTRELTVPVFCIGYAAPFGRDVLGKGAGVRLGPETPTPEFLRFEVTGGGTVLMDSGYGPWDLEYVCRAAGGTYLAIRPKASRIMMASVFDESWPSDQAARFDPATMAKYAPQYVPAEKYRELAEGNAAIAALLRVAQEYETIPVLQSPSVQFSADDEAQMKRALDQAQQPAALLSPTVNQVYERLKEGEGDRAKISQPRWQAAYDLALGQALANVVRVDGYNGMLAQLKTGKSFQNKGSDVWVLEGANTIDTSSLMRSKLEQAVELLQGVIDKHPGTPWAYLAEQELKTPIGYEWKELDLDR